MRPFANILSPQARATCKIKLLPVCFVAAKIGQSDNQKMFITPRFCRKCVHLILTGKNYALSM
jgi:hypothetical protein